MDKLNSLRVDIDGLDQNIILSLGKRQETILEIAAVKQTLGLPERDNDRWQKALAARLTWAKDQKLDTALVANIFDIIHDWSIKIQKTNA